MCYPLRRCATSPTFRRSEQKPDQVSDKKPTRNKESIKHRKIQPAAQQNHFKNYQLLTSNYDCTIDLLRKGDLDEILANNNRYAFTLLLSAMNNSDKVTFEKILSKRSDLLTLEDDKGNLLLNIATRPDSTIFLQIMLNQLVPELNREKILLNGIPSIRYPLPSSSGKAKSHYEALLAKSILELPENIKLIRDISKTLVNKINDMSNDEWQTYVKYHQAAQEQLNFPTSKLFDITSKETFATQLLKVASSQENHIIDLLSAIYRISSIVLEKNNPCDTDRIYEIYSKFNHIGRNHTVNEQWWKPESHVSEHRLQPLTQIGYSKIQSDLMQNLNPLKMRSAYYHAQPSTNTDNQKHSLALKNKLSGMPYIAGK
ncbi:hypothetical protein [Endozoicomonas ascidiicola]|uniref:hypothetical protein n=1 Tax=Endozoicomonas ascidiicola TaxID=1698521 RepID=UPI00082F3878|nr:hypothetical protein [Endozoicomonas ascidiicola]